MAWFKVDDGFHASRKVLSIPRAQRMAAIGLWTVAGTWSAHEELDGAVPAYMISELGGTKKLATVLVGAGLWETAEDGWQFRKWAEYQPTRAKLDEARAKEAERKARWRNRGKDASVPPGHDVGQTQGHQAESHDASEHPDPTRPDPTSSKEEVKRPPARGTRVPTDFTLTDEMREWGAKETPDVDLDKKLPEFIDYWKGVPGQRGVKLDWLGTWRNGMRKQQEFAERARATAKKPVDTDAWMNAS